VFEFKCVLRYCYGNHYYPLSVRIPQDSPIDIIVGREIIKRLNFVSMLPQFFFESLEIPNTVPAGMLTRGLIEVTDCSRSQTQLMT
jgi:hypothetical protein